MKRRHRWILFGALVTLTLPAWVSAQAKDAGVTTSKKKETAEAPVPVAGVRYNSANRRDPFLNPLLLRQKSKENDNEEEARGQPPPGIAGTYIAQAVLLGISQRPESQTAVFQGPDRRAYFLQEGDRMFDGYVKKIDDDAVLLVRETKLRSGKVLTQEVTKRLRTR